MRLPPLSAQAVAKLARAPGFHQVPLAKTFNPDQPRVPAGTFGGGQWTGGGAGASGPIRTAANRPTMMTDAGQGKTWKKAWVGQTHEAMRQQIAAWENPDNRNPESFGYDIANIQNKKNVALGRYQLTKPALQDIGLENKHGSWRTDTDFYWKYHIANDQAFLNDESAQEYAMTAYLAKLQKETDSLLREYGGRIFRGVKGDPIAITQAGVIAAAHREGAYELKDYLHAFGGGDTWGKDKQMHARHHHYYEIETRLREGQFISY